MRRVVVLLGAALWLAWFEPAVAQDGGVDPAPDDALAALRLELQAYLIAPAADADRLAGALAATPLPRVRAAAALPCPTPLPAPGTQLWIEVAVPEAPPTRALVRIPPASSSPPAELPVLVALHYTTGTAEAMAQYWAPATDAHGILLVAPQATLNRDKGWGSTPAERAAILAVVREVLLRFPADPDRLALTGMSMGAHASWEMGMLYPSLAVALFPECGCPRKENVPLLANLAGRPLVWHEQGALDQPELVAAARVAAARLEAAGGRIRYDEHPDRGHEFFPESRDARLEAFLAERRVAPPDKLAYRCPAPVLGRTHWLRIDALDERAYALGERIELVFRGEAPSEEETFRKLWAEIDERLAIVEARRDVNRFFITSKRVKRLTLLLDSTTFSPEHRILVRWNGKESARGESHGSARVLLENLRATGDRHRLVDIEIPLGRE